MDSADFSSSVVPRPGRLINDALPWASMTLDYTERIANLIPLELLDWRPVDPSGHFCFSLAELVMHCADARRLFASQLSGEADEQGYWSGGPEEGGAWKFKPDPGKEALLQSLKNTRALFEPYLNRPADELLEETEGTRQAYARNLEFMRDHGHDTSRLEQSGAPNIMRVIFALTVHEAAHRSAMQTLLHQHGIATGGEE